MLQVKVVLILGSIFSLIGLSSTYASSIRGTVYKVGSHRQEVLYTSLSSRVLDSDRLIETVVFKSLSGQTVFKEKVIFEKDRVVSYSTESMQDMDHGMVKVQNKRLFFEYQSGKKKKMDDEGLTDNFVVGLSLLALIQKNWKQLINEDTVKIRFAVLDRQETVGFKLFRVKEKESSSEVIVIKMKPSSFIISAIVDPVYFYIDKQGNKMLSYVGRVSPKIKKGSKWKPLDAEVVYEHLD